MNINNIHGEESTPVNTRIAEEDSDWLSPVLADKEYSRTATSHEDRYRTSDSDTLSPARALVALLRGSKQPRSKVALLRLGKRFWGAETNLAAQLNVGVACIARRVLESLPEGATFIPLDSAQLLSYLDSIASDVAGSNVVLVLHLELLLTKLTEEERDRFWEGAFVRLPHRPRALVLAMPQGFERFEPDFERWQDSGRAASVE